MNDRPVVIVGAGGHAKVLCDILLKNKVSIKGVVDPSLKEGSLAFNLLPVLGGDEYVAQFDAKEINLVNGLGSVGINSIRRRVYERFKSQGYSFISVIHPRAILADDIRLAEGVQVMAGAIIQPGTRIDENVIVNTKASIDHDCKIGAHTHLAPGVTLSGSVSVGVGCHLGTGTIVTQGVVLEDDSFVRAGCLVSPSAQSVAYRTKVTV